MAFCPDSAPGQSSSTCALCYVNPVHIRCVKSVLAKPFPLQRQQNCRVMLFIDRYKRLDEGQVRKSWQSWEEHQHLVRGQAEGEDSCVGSDTLIPFSQLLPLELALPFPGWFVAQVFLFAAAAVIHFRGGSIPECLPAVLLRSGAMLGKRAASFISDWLQVCWETFRNWADSSCLMFQTHLCSFVAECEVSWASPGVVVGDRYHGSCCCHS